MWPRYIICLFFFYLFQSSAIFSFLGFPGPPHLMEFVSMTFNLYFRISTSPWSQFYFLMVCSLFRFNTTVTCSSLFFSSHFPSTFYPPLKHTASTTIHQTLLSYRFLLLSAYHKNSPLTICRFNHSGSIPTMKSLLQWVSNTLFCPSCTLWKTLFRSSF